MDEDIKYEEIFHGFKARINEGILMRRWSLIRTDNKTTKGWYLIQWVSKPYTLQEDTNTMKYDQLQTSVSE